ncbi:MAG: nuclear transport factor 2 family protein [Pseudomonadota bacterium]
MSTEEETNVAMLRDAYTDWHNSRGGSVDHWVSLMADEIAFMSLAQGAQGVEFTKAMTSKEQVGGYFDGLCSQFEMEHFTVDEYIAQGDRVVAIGSTAWTNRATGKRVETPKVDIFRLRDGKIVSFEEYYDTAGLIACTTC